MAKGHYNVVAILPGRRNDYFDFWKNDVRKNSDGEDLHPAMLATVVGVDARSKTDAEEQVRKMHPDHSIDSAATKKLG